MGVYVVDHAAEEGRQSLRRGQRGLQSAGTVAQRGDFPVVDRLGQCLPGGEVAVQRAGAHPGQAWLAWPTAHFEPVRANFAAHSDPDAEEPREVCRDTLAEARRLGVAVPRLEAAEPSFAREVTG